MGESEILQSFTNVTQIVLSIFSTFFAIVSAYIVALFYFLHRSPWPLRVLAFFLLTMSLLFLGAVGATMQQVWTGLIAAWPTVGAPKTGIGGLAQPFGAGFPFSYVSHNKAGVAISWATAIACYLALAYLTFWHRWNRNGAKDDQR